MKYTIILALAFVLISCSSKEDRVKVIIGNSYSGGPGIKKMSEIYKIKEDVFSLPVYYSIVEKYIDVTNENDYEIVRYIFKTNDGAYRMFYLIDLTGEKIVDKSSDYNAFFKPIATEILGDNLGDIEGNNLMDLMRY